MFGLAQDSSQISSQLTYQTTTGLPWALAINPGSSEAWKHPREMIDILHAYPKFQEFVETNGNKETTWFSQANAVNSKLYQQ